MLNVGVVGLGMMGLTHLDAYAKLPGVKVAAIADADADRRSGKVRARGNIEGQARGAFDFATAAQYADAAELIRDPRVDAVDICLPTPLHLRFALLAMEAGKPVLLEKPLARSAADADRIADAAEQANVIAMPAMCMRFWPGWTWLKEAVDARTFGRALGAQFRRVASHPGGPFYRDADASGGAALDLHIHDTDFVRFLFGTPRAVRSSGYAKVTTGLDHLLTQYVYDDVPLVSAEGGWAMEEGFPFRMQYTVNFERATAVFDSSAASPLTLYESGKPPVAVPVETVMGYEIEIAYFVECVKEGRSPGIVTLRDGAAAVRIIEAEVESVRSGQPVELK